MAYLLRLGVRAGPIAAAASLTRIRDQPEFSKCEMQRTQSMKRSGSFMDAKKDPGNMKKTLLYKNYTSKYGENKSVQLFYSDVAELLKGIGLSDQYIASRVFKVMDADGSGSVEYAEIAAFCAMLGRGALDEKMKFIFDACDLNSNGQIEAYELRKFVKHMIMNCVAKLPHYVMLTEESDVAMFQDLDNDAIAQAVANRMVYEIFKVADTDKGGSIDFKEFSFWYKRGDKKVKQFASVFGLFDLLVAEGVSE